MSNPIGLGRQRGGPALGFSYEGRPPGLLAAVAPHVDLIEVVPDCLVGATGDLQESALAELDEHASHLPLIYHGIGLSIGTVDGWNDDYLDVLDALVAHRRPLWHSEHLGFSVVDGHFLGTMAALPATQASIELVARRATALRERCGIELLLEHVATPLPRPDVIPLGRYLNEIAAASGCGLLLDLHNLECDEDNGLLHVDNVLADLDLGAVREIHVAAGIWDAGFHLDVHTGRPERSTLTLLEQIVPQCEHLGAVVFELLAEAVPLVGIDAIVDELGALRSLLDAEPASSSDGRPRQNSTRPTLLGAGHDH
jgi:uncharacterized protein (UPF0276 family)